MNLLDLIWDLFRKPRKVEMDTRRIVSNESAKMVMKEWTENVWLGDLEYYLICEEELKEFLKSNPVDGRRYVLESHDCEDFAFEMKADVCELYAGKKHGGAFGIVWGNNSDGRSHAWNFFINTEGKIKFLEPQLDQIYDPSIEKIWIMIM